VHHAAKLDEPMYKLRSLDKFEIAGRGTAYVVESPVTAERTFAAISEKIGPLVEIDGEVFEPAGLAMNLPSSPVRIGERISILVRPNP
jgi:hypothetical protein